MKKITIALFLIFAMKQTFANDSQIVQPITNMFDAMREHDGDKLLAQFTAGAMLERATKEDTIEVSDLQKFAEFVKQTPKYLDEHLLNIDVRTSDNLASVWTPYAFYLDEKLSHCGVNSFQLIKVNNKWKIQYLIDNTHQGNCDEFIARHKKTSD
ncbi:hypothetical protein [Thalassotalea sediminis]|uniref:hypothetical protein n=1 Tax=Thalassotalea sediminis TaxID=1759089 RepID=UPI002572E362|nr:hypothetical protein [Thalassotalea sediminis]